jgi:hypothetical protein
MLDKHSSTVVTAMAGDGVALQLLATRRCGDGRQRVVATFAGSVVTCDTVVALVGTRCSSRRWPTHAVARNAIAMAGSTLQS